MLDISLEIRNQKGSTKEAVVRSNECAVSIAAVGNRHPNVSLLDVVKAPSSILRSTSAGDART